MRKVHRGYRKYSLPSWLSRRWGVAGLLCLALLCTGCSGDSGSGAVALAWGQQACDRCRMIVGDRLHAAQVRHTPPGESSEIFYFDDFGCAVIWLQDKPWKDGPGVEIWVTDHRSGNWIDAHTAHYVGGHTTAMGYSLGAQAEPLLNGLDYAQATAHVLEIEKRLKIHGGSGGTHAH